jgi:hypothetical protein
MVDMPHASHADAAQRVAYSNFAHRVVGALFGAVGILAALEYLGLLGGFWRYAWPALLIVAGMFVPIFIWAVARKYQIGLRQVLADPQQRQHFALSGLVLASGIAETLRVASVLPSLMGYVWPAALVLIGYGFISHTQHGTSDAVAKATRAHRLLGFTVILADLARALQLLLGEQAGALGLVWIVLILLAAVQFLIYHEPVGAYATEGHSA